MLNKIPSPCYVLEEVLLRKNLELIADVQQRAGVSIILALKGFSMWKTFPFVKKYLSGATASSLNEARLVYEEMGCKAHTYAVAYMPSEFEEMLTYSSHLVFNSVAQYAFFRPQIEAHSEKVSCGIRVNPEYSEVETELYNPAAPGSRLGEVDDKFKDGLPAGIEGLHFHTLCESTSYELEKTLTILENKFGHLFPHLKWVNMGGGHLMTKKGYDTDHLVKILTDFRKKHKVEILLEPGSAIAWETGDLHSQVMDIHESRGIKTAILNMSFTAHTPDCLEMPYRPKVVGATDPIEDKPTYRLGGVSCLAGDYLTEYSFEKPLNIGDPIVFKDMIHYTLVKTTMFNGVKHPSIAILRENGELEIMKAFGYTDYKGRMD
ncbi:MAG: carboxynorspermidine decarboxylase [Paraglaciecola sp.]|jgi:carboxynorspermidine decarboxylase